MTFMVSGTTRYSQDRVPSLSSYFSQPPHDYEKGVYSTIPIHWDEAAHTLTVGERKGSFPGIQETRTLRIVFVGEGHGSGIGLTAEPDKIVQYSGKQITITP